MRTNGTSIRYQNQWLPLQMNIGQPDKELHSNILKENPVPDNVEQVKKLDEFAISILKIGMGLLAMN